MTTGLTHFGIAVDSNLFMIFGISVDMPTDKDMTTELTFFGIVSERPVD